MSPSNISTTILRPGCKVNIFLEILGLREDGFHELRTLFYPLSSPHDTLTVAPGPPGCGLQFSCSDSSLNNDQNILTRCYQLYVQTTGIAPDLQVHLTKNIPTGAGLGGGSSDAATFLHYLRSLPNGPDLDQACLVRIATALGSDVPFFLLNQPALAQGRGEQLTPVSISTEGLTLLLACPSVHVSTAWAYKAWDDYQLHKSDRSVSLTQERLTDIVFSLSNFVFHNSFEVPVFTKFPELRELKELLLRLGASGVVLSGSGASLFAVFRKQRLALLAREHFRKLNIPTYHFTS